MRAIIFATHARKDRSSITRFHSTYMLKIADKPMIFYVIESLVSLGILHIDIILRQHPLEIEEALGDGKRWGAFITYHLAAYKNYPLMPIFPALDVWKNERLVVAEGDTLPALHPEIFTENTEKPCCALIYPEEQWSGWCLIQAGLLNTLPKKISSEEFNSWINTHSHKYFVEPLFSTQTPQDLLNANIKAISKDNKTFFLPSSAQHVEKGIWLSRGISLHPTAKFEPPVFIGEFCQIRAGVSLGPYAIIENRCIVDTGSKIQQSLICQNSYVGENLHINESIVDRNLLINLMHNTAIRIRENFILSDLARKSIFRTMFHWMGRLTALALFLGLSPFYLFLIATCPLQKATVVHLPAPEDPSHWSFLEWTTFNPPPGCRFKRLKELFNFLPLLLLISQGKIHFVGTAPRSQEDILKLPSDWQKLYLKSKIGLINLANLDSEHPISEDEQYAAETYYSTQMSIRYDLKLFFRWLKKKLCFKVWA